MAAYDVASMISPRPCYERSDGSSQTNPVEAQKIVNIVKKMVQGHDVLPCDIGIVTPYAAQVRAIKKLLNGGARCSVG
jgi:superfamily I DNA and/or RNA helicase